MSVNAEAGKGDYGKISILKLPTGKTVDGPKQVQSQFNSEPDIAESIRLLRGGDSEVEYGNLLTVPLDGGFLYVEPVYVRGGDLKYPLLKKVVGDLRRCHRLRGHPRRGAQQGVRRRGHDAPATGPGRG